MPFNIVIQMKLSRKKRKRKQFKSQKRSELPVRMDAGMFLMQIKFCFCSGCCLSAEAVENLVKRAKGHMCPSSHEHVC